MLTMYNYIMYNTNTTSNIDNHIDNDINNCIGFDYCSQPIR